MNENTALKKNGPASAVSTREADRALYTPRVDILETEDGLVLYADMPGVKPADVDVSFQDGELILHGRCEAPRVDAGVVWTEYGVGDFHRVFTLNEEVNPDRITADLKHGVLTVHLPRPESVKPRKITVKGE